MDASTADSPTNPTDSGTPTDGSTPPSGAVVEVIAPVADLNAAAMGMSRVGHVVLAVGLTSLDQLYRWKDGASTKIEIPSAFRYEPTGLTTRVCVTSTGQVGFDARKGPGGASYPVFFDGTTVVDPGFTGGIPLSDCNDGPRVIAKGVGIGGKSYFWNNTGAPIELPNSSARVNGTGTVLASNGTWKDGTFSEFPSGIDVGAVAINDDGLVVGNVIEGSSLKPVSYKLGDPAVTKLPAPPGLAAGKAYTALDVNNAGDILVNSDKEWWVYTGGAYKPVVADAYKMTRAVGLDGTGRVLLGASRKDNTGKVVAIFVKP